jgi:hypothetical protein
MKPLNSLGLLLSLSSALLLSACGDSNETASSDTENGELQIAITDAEEDFLSYQIELDAITLNRQDGSKVSVLPLSTDIDFVQYQELSELFAVLSVPAGTYTSISLSLDYTGADIVIQDENGEQYQASAVDSDGNPMTEVDIELRLNDDNPVRITPRKVAQLTLDLDLAASNTIESFEPAIVTVEPFMIGTAERDLDREHRVRGLLSEANEDDMSISLNVRPMRLKQGEFGTFSFKVNDATSYEINGVEFTGSEGLSAITQLAIDTPVIAFGGADTDNDTEYLASKVNAGNSVPWAESDVLKGMITARSGNTLTLEGAVLELRDDAEESEGHSGHFKQTVQVRISENSGVTGYRLGDANISNLSIGQRVIALGDYDAQSNLFNAEQGNIRMKLNRIVGEVTQASPLQIELSHINKRPVEIFDFSGTGSTEELDASPENYKIETSDLMTASIEAAEWIQLRGYPTAFGSAPLDFEALSIVNPEFSSHTAKLHARWAKDALNTVTIENSQLVLNTTTVQSKLHLVGVPGSSSLELSVENITGTEEQGRFSILIKDQGVDVYRAFSDFVSALQTNLDTGLEVSHLTASGAYSDTEHNLTSHYLTVKLVLPETETETETETD